MGLVWFSPDCLHYRTQPEREAHVWEAAGLLAEVKKEITAKEPRF